MFSIDNHYSIGGQGDRIAYAIASSDINVKPKKMALREIPACGTNPEILSNHGMDVAGIEQAIRGLITKQ